MRKYIIAFFAILFLASFAAAKVTVKTQTSSTKQKDGSIVVVDGMEDTEVNYAGVKIFVPAGTKVIISQDSEGNIIVRGMSISGVKIGGSTISSRGECTFSVQPKSLVVAVQQGTIRLTDKQGRSAAYGQGTSVSAKTGETIEGVLKTKTLSEKKKQEGTSDDEDEDEDIPEYVAEDSLNDTESQQATKDVKENKILSPSAP